MSATSWLRKVTVQFHIWSIGAWENLTRLLYLLVYFDKIVVKLLGLQCGGVAEELTVDVETCAALLISIQNPIFRFWHLRSL